MQKNGPKADENGAEIDWLRRLNFPRANGHFCAGNGELNEVSDETLKWMEKSLDFFSLSVCPVEPCLHI